MDRQNHQNEIDFSNFFDETGAQNKNQPSSGYSKNQTTIKRVIKYLSELAKKRQIVYIILVILISILSLYLVLNKNDGENFQEKFINKPQFLP